MSVHICTSATLAGPRCETDKNGNVVALIYTCNSCGAQTRRKS